MPWSRVWSTRGSPGRFWRPGGAHGGPALEQLVVRLLTQLEDSPAIDALVDQQVGRVLQALEKSEAVRQLVREQAGAYLEYITEHPEPVQQLIQDQSRGMARDFQERVACRCARRR